MSQPSKGVTKFWDKKLGEDLQALDLPDGRVSNRGSGKINDEGRGKARVASGAEIESRQVILRANKFRSAQDKAIWRLYAEGKGRTLIGTELQLGDRTVRNSISRSKQKQIAAPQTIRHLAKTSDLNFLLTLLVAIRKTNAKIH